MLGGRPGRMLGVVVILSVFIVGGVGVCRYLRGRQEISAVSIRFVQAAIALDLPELRQCLTASGKAMLRASYAKYAAQKLARSGGTMPQARVTVEQLITDDSRATVRLRSQSPNAENDDAGEEWVLICRHENGRWLVDLDATLRRGRCPIASSANLKERLNK